MSRALVGSSRSRIGACCAKRAREHDALAFAAAQRSEAARREVDQVEPDERGVCDLEVAAALPSEIAEVRRAAEKHVLGDGHRRWQLRELRDERDAPRQLAAAERSAVVTADLDGALPLDEPGDRAQQRALAGAVRADHRHPLPRLDRAADAVEDARAAEID